MKKNPFQCWKAESGATSISEHEFWDDIKQMTMNTGTAGLVSPHLPLETEPSYASPRLASEHNSVHWVSDKQGARGDI